MSVWVHQPAEQMGNAFVHATEERDKPEASCASTLFCFFSQPSSFNRPSQWSTLHCMLLIIDQKDLDRLPITIDPEIVSGTPVFQGTRVPVDALISNLEAGLTLDEFLDNFPTVTREQALQVLEFSKTTLLKLRKTA